MEKYHFGAGVFVMVVHIRLLESELIVTRGHQLCPMIGSFVEFLVSVFGASVRVSGVHG